jgi:hypothetical protein
MQRAKIDMTWKTYERALTHVIHYCAEQTQQELALTGIGEGTLYPRFVEAVLIARDVIGANRLLTFSTNGLTLTEEILDGIRPADPTVYVSLHRPEAAAPAVEILRKSGLKFGINESFVTSALDWAGTVDWHVSHKPQPCEYLRQGWAVVRSDGTVGTCCWDAESVSGRIGHVDDKVGTFTTWAHDACKSCSLSVPDSMREAA